MPGPCDWTTAATWGRLNPAQRIVWCRAAGVDVMRALDPFAKLDMPEKIALVVALGALEAFALDVATC